MLLNRVLEGPRGPPSSLRLGRTGSSKKSLGSHNEERVGLDYMVEEVRTMFTLLVPSFYFTRDSRVSIDHRLHPDLRSRKLRMGTGERLYVYRTDYT